MIPPEELASVFVWGGGGECGCVRVGVCVTVCVFVCVCGVCVCNTGSSNSALLYKHPNIYFSVTSLVDS